MNDTAKMAKDFELLFFGLKKIEPRFKPCGDKNPPGKFQTVKEETFLVARLENDGQFFGLDEDVHTTSPFLTIKPEDAHLIEYRPGEKIENPSYYFENSSRMRYWLTGFKMVKVRIKTKVESEIL